VERCRYSGERLGHPNVGATGQENERLGFLLETAEPLLDVGGCELEMGGNLDRARRSACIDEVLVDPQPDLRVADEATLRRVNTISIHSLLNVGRIASRHQARSLRLPCVAWRLRKAPPRYGLGKMRANYSRKVMVEGKGFVYLSALSIRYFVAITLQNAAN
jgi:hypothetical protein